MYVRVHDGLKAPPEQRQPDIVRIILVDPTGRLKSFNKLREAFRSQLEGKFNNLDANWLRQAHLRFQVQYRSDEPSNQEKAAFGKLDFPVYLLELQHTSDTINALMTQHKVPRTINGQNLYDIAQQCWEDRDTLGCGIPSGEGLRKVGFIKSHRIFDVATGDISRAFVNETAHEIGHMGNLQQHSKTGLMRYPVPLNVDIDFNNEDKRLFLSDLQRLRRLQEQTTGSKPQSRIREFRWVFK